MDLPTAMIELQQQFFLDFIFLWRSWIGDPITWHYGSRVFNAFNRAILRLASWDFVVSYDCDVALPINHSSIPSWQFPEEERYWFHGFLIILQPDLTSPQLLRTAIAGVKAFIDSSIVYLTKFGLSLSHRTMWLLSTYPNTTLRAARFSRS